MYRETIIFLRWLCENLEPLTPSYWYIWKWPVFVPKIHLIHFLSPIKVTWLRLYHQKLNTGGFYHAFQLNVCHKWTIHACSVVCSQALVGVCSHLYASLRQVDADGQPLSHTDIWVLCLLEGFLQRLQLRHSERRAAAALLLLVAVPSLQNELWQDREKEKCQLQSILWVGSNKFHISMLFFCVSGMQWRIDLYGLSLDISDISDIDLLIPNRLCIIRRSR